MLSHVVGIVSYLVVLAEGLPHFLQLRFQLLSVTVTKLLSAHLLGEGEAVDSFFQVKGVLFLQRIRSHVGQVPPTHLREENIESRDLRKEFVVSVKYRSAGDLGQWF